MILSMVKKLELIGARKEEGGGSSGGLGERRGRGTLCGKAGGKEKKPHFVCGGKKGKRNGRPDKKTRNVVKGGKTLFFVAGKRESRARKKRGISTRPSLARGN